MMINWRFILSKWWKAVLMGWLIAVGIALWPQAQCAIAQTCNTPRDVWCGSGRCCAPSTGLSAVTFCEKVPISNLPGYAICVERGPGFGEPPVHVRCTNSDNCLVTEVLGTPNRLSGENWSVGKCTKYMVFGNESCGNPDTSANPTRATCCVGSSGSGGGCVSQYAPPSIEDGYTVVPPNPIVWTQEQPPYGDALGMTINDIKAHGGEDTTCGRGRANITHLTMQISLRGESRAWIEEDLAYRYPGARVKDTYPKNPEVAAFGHPSAVCSTSTGVIGAGTPDAELDCRFFRPLDPGKYDIIVTACQSDGQCTSKTLPEPVLVWLLEVRLVR